MLLETQGVFSFWVASLAVRGEGTELGLKHTPSPSLVGAGDVGSPSPMPVAPEGMGPRPFTLWGGLGCRIEGEGSGKQKERAECGEGECPWVTAPQKLRQSWLPLGRAREKEGWMRAHSLVLLPSHMVRVKL